MILFHHDQTLNKQKGQEQKVMFADKTNVQNEIPDAFVQNSNDLNFNKIDGSLSNIVNKIESKNKSEGNRNHEHSYVHNS